MESEKRSISVRKIAKDLDLTVMAGEAGIDGRVSVEMLARPGVEFAGFLDFYDKDRILLIGSKESSFLKLLDIETQKLRVEAVIKYLPPAVVFSVNVTIPDLFIELGNQYDILILKHKERTTDINSL